MKTKILFVLLSLFIFTNIKSQPKLSSSAKIYLLTCQSGNELYSTFGHSAIWISDDSTKTDFVYNYGTFDFETPNFYGKFAHGKLDYMLSVSNIQYFMKEYQYYNRSVFYQELNFNFYQKQQIFNLLQTNALPQNRFYRYDFFFDNCATRIRDIFKKATGDSLVFVEKDINVSFRKLISPSLEGKSWEKLGLDIILGAKTDRKAKPYEYMLLPNYVRDACQGAKLKTKTGTVPLEAKRGFLFQSEPVVLNKSFFIPTRVFSILFLLILLSTYFGNRKERIYHIIDFPLFFFTGLLGLILTYLWFFSDHKLIANNWNVIWAFPLNFFMAFTLFRKRKSNFATLYFLSYGLLMFLLVAVWFFIPQKMNYALIPVALSLGLRSVFIYARAQNKKL